MSFKLPQYDKRTVVVGSTGSGKTQFAVWLLSTRDFHIRPWVIFDFKGDELIEQINPPEINVYGPPPKKPGLYVVRPVPQRDDDAVADFLWACWAQEEIGLYFDEGYMLGQRNPALNACLTQGRSKHIEMITLSQRPVWMSKFVFSEANYFVVMNLTLGDDRKYISSYVGGQEINLLPPYHSLWYDADRQKSFSLKPVPGRDELLSIFEKKMSRKIKAI